MRIQMMENMCSAEKRERERERQRQTEREREDKTWSDLKRLESSVGLDQVAASYHKPSASLCKLGLLAALFCWVMFLVPPLSKGYQKTATPWTPHEEYNKGGFLTIILSHDICTVIS